jgi:hypothetical protein
MRCFLVLVACLSSLLNGASAAPLRFVAEVYGDTQHNRKESFTAPVSTSVTGGFAVPPYGTAQWDVSASAGDTSLSARAFCQTVATNIAGLSPDVGVTALAFVDDTLYFSRGQGAVHLAMTLALSGSCNATAGDNPFGGPRATCLGGLSVVINGNGFFGVSGGTEETRIWNFDTGGSGTGDLAIAITYSLEIQGEAHDGVVNGDYSHTGHLYLSAPGGFRTESGRSYAPPPTLSIQRVGSNVVISWSTNAPGYQLESTTNLGAGSQWVAVTNTPAPVGLEKVVTNSVSPLGLFYRLKK